jgi:hypothetical protein
MVASSRDERAEILKIASKMTRDCHDANRVLANAGPMVDWLEAARSRGDLTTRMDALTQHYSNVREDGDVVDEVLDDPAKFLEGASAFYAFLTANDDKLEVTDWVIDDETDEATDEGANGE